jgi:uncharacterized membrane protein YhaH (DUF805 family)
MNWGQFLFSFRGRVNRAKYWLYVLGAFVVAFILSIVLMTGTAVSPVALMPLAAVAVVIYLLLLYAGLAVGSKRLHDRNKSAWWLLMFYLAPAVLGAIGQASGSEDLRVVLGLVSLAIGIWAFVELGCMGGIIGPNQYGPDPIPETAVRTR